jgi:hypothetical protein
MLIMFSWIAFNTPVFSQECDPSKFVYSDFERLNYSDSLALAVIDTMSSENAENKSQSFDLSAIVKGTPVKASFDDAKSVSNFIQTSNNLNFSHDQKVDLFRSNLSLVSASMYESCLKRLTSEFEVHIPDSAYTDDDFILSIVWHSTSPIRQGDEIGKARIMVLGGTVDGKSESEKDVGDKNSVSFIVRRSDASRSLQIVPTVNDIPYDRETGSILIPPRIQSSVSAMKRDWPENGAAFQKIERGDSGSPYGSSAFTSTECITASTGILLPSTLAIEHAGNNYPPPAITPDSGPAKVCVAYGVYGEDYFGKKGYSSLDKLGFSVVEVIPDAQPSVSP